MIDLYKHLSGIRFLKKNYAAKFLFIAFIGIHIPLIIIVLISITSFIDLDKSSILLITLFSTLAASGITLYLLNKLLIPLHLAKNALRIYRSDGRLPTLPTQFEDEAGILLKELQYSLEQLDYLIHEKKDIIRLLSQDIRSPYLQIYELARRIPAEQDPLLKTEWADQIKDITVSNLLVLQDILKLLEFEDTDEMTATKLDLNQLVYDTLKRLTPLAAEKSIHIDANIAHEPLFVNGSRLLLTEAITQLLQNAIKFSFRHNKIHLSTNCHNGMVRFSVKDQGLGIEESERKLIFQRFTLAKKRGTAGEYGLGTGLFLSQKIASKCKGRVEVTSEGKNLGSQFSLLIPGGK